MKKIISMFLVLAMAAALVAVPFSASAASSNVAEWKIFNSTKNYIQKDSTTSRVFQCGSGSTGTVTYSETGVEGVTEDPVFNVTSTKLICNYYSTNESVDGVQVLDFNFKVYVDEADLNTQRCITLSTKTAKAAKTSSAAKLYYTVKNGGFVKADKDGSNTNLWAENNSSYKLSGSEWHDISIHLFVLDGVMWYGMYYDGNHIGTVYSVDKTYTSVKDAYLNQITFNNGGADTYIKDIRLDAYDSALNEVGPKLTIVNCDTISTDPTGGALNAPAYTGGTVLQSSSNSTSQYYSNKTYQNVVYTAEDGALKVALTPSESTRDTHALIQNFRKDLTSYFPSDSTKYMQMYYDVKVAEGSESSIRKQMWRLGNNTGATSQSVYNITSSIKDGELTFKAESGQDALEEKSVSYDVASDKWYRVMYLLKVENKSDSEYAIHAEGYGMDLETGSITKVYEADTAIGKLTAGTNGFVLNQQRTDIITPGGNDEVVTYYDNFVLSVLDETFGASLSGVVNAVPSDEDYEFPIDIKNDNGTVTARYRDVGGTTQQILLVGVDSNGNVLGGNVGSTVYNKGIVTATWTVSSGTKKVEAYVLNGDYENLRPITASKELAIN